MEKKLIPFNLKRAVAGDCIVTRAGIPVKVAGYNPAARDGARLTGWVHNLVRSWNDEGVYCDHNGNVGQFKQMDLFMAPKERTVWVNLYDPENIGNGIGVHHASEAASDSYHLLVRPGYLVQRLGNKAHKITFEE